MDPINDFDFLLVHPKKTFSVVFLHLNMAKNATVVSL